MSQIDSVTTRDFQSQVLDAALPVLVDFYADWCRPCRMLGPILDRLSVAYAGKVKFCKVNVDKEPQLASQFQVQSIPTMAFLLEGEVVGMHAGLASEESLRQAVQQLIELSATHRTA